VGINFVNPWVLTLALPMVAFIIWSSGILKERKNAKQRSVAILRCVIILLLILSLAGTSIRKYTDRTTVIYLVDLSESTRNVREDMALFIQESLKDKSEKHNVGIVAFGKNALVEQPIAQDIYFSGLETMPEPHFTNIDKGLQMAAALMPSNTRKRVVLLTDSNQNIGDGMERAKALLRQGIRVDGVFFATQPQYEVQISSLELPSKLYQGEMYDIYVTVDSTHNTSGTLRLYANRRLISEQQVQLQKGENRFVFKDIADEGGIKTYEADIQVNQDGTLKNNRMAAYTDVRGKPAVALVEGEEGEARELNKILEGSGIEVRMFTPLSLPSSLDELRKYHGLVLCDVAAEDLRDGKLEIIESYVKNLGRGLLVSGGDNSYALGGYMGTPLEDMLPVDLNLEKKADIPSLGLLLVIDKSGSMATKQYGISKMDMAKEAAVRSMESLRPNDYIGVVVFDGEASWVVETQKPEEMEKIKEAILSIPPGGGTNIYPGLKMAYDSLSGLNTKLKHIILLTDGQSQPGDFEGIVEKMREAGITLSTVAVGSDSDQALLERLAQLGDGRYYFTDEFTNIPKIFTKETYLASKSYIQNRTFFPLVTGYSPVLSGFSKGFPLLHGFIATLPKNTAEVSLSSDQMDPILAEWQYGLGRVIAWTSDLRGVWTEDWLQWEQAPKFWLNVISRILPIDDESQGHIQTYRVGDIGTVEVTLGENLDESLDSKAVVVDPDGKEQEIDLNIVEPGKYKGDFDVSIPGVYLVRVEQRKDREIVNTLDSGLAVTYSPEYDIRQGGSREILERIVKQAGGKILDAPDQVFKDDLEPVWTQTEIWPGLLILALILFVFDIAIRRLNLRIWKGKRKSRISAPSEESYRRSNTQALVTDKVEISFEARVKEREKPIQTESEKQEESTSLSSQLLNARKMSKRKKL